MNQINLLNLDKAIESTSIERPKVYKKKKKKIRYRGVVRSHFYVLKSNDDRESNLFSVFEKKNK